MRKLWFRFINQFASHHFSRGRLWVCWWGAHWETRPGYWVICWHPYDGSTPFVYWSPNATPWHHDARLPFRRAPIQQWCSCTVCQALRELSDDGYRAVPGQ